MLRGPLGRVQEAGVRDLPVLGDWKPQDPGRPWWRTRFGRVRVLAARRQRRHDVGGGCAGDGWRRRGCRVGRLGAMLWRSCCFAVPGNEQGPLTAVRSRSAGCRVADSLALVIGSTGGGVRRGVLRRGHRSRSGASANTAADDASCLRDRFPASLLLQPASVGGGETSDVRGCRYRSYYSSRDHDTRGAPVAGAGCPAVVFPAALQLDPPG